MYLPQITAYLCWILYRNMNAPTVKKRVFVLHLQPVCSEWDWNFTSAKWTNSSISTRLTAYLCSTCSLSVRNGTETWLPLNEQIPLSALDLQHICAELELEIWLAPSDGLRGLALDMQSLCAEYGLQKLIALIEEICLLALDLQPICTKYGLKTWLEPSVEILVLALPMQLICAQYGLQTWHAPNEEIQLLRSTYAVLNIGPKACFAPTQEMCILDIDLLTTVQNLGSKYVSRFVTKFVYWRSTWSLFVRNMSNKHELRQQKKFV
jgi:hypothetical protein